MPLKIQFFNADRCRWREGRQYTHCAILSPHWYGYYEIIHEQDVINVKNVTRFTVQYLVAGIIY